MQFLCHLSGCDANHYFCNVYQYEILKLKSYHNDTIIKLNNSNFIYFRIYQSLLYCYETAQ